jgi:UDP-N-acetylmuramoylalanine--D-glutamate ligase
MIQDLFAEYFYGKKVTVMGLGLLGRGVGDTQFLAEQKSDIIVTDLKDKEALTESLQVLEGYDNITYHLGAHVPTDFEKRDFILKAAGVPLDSPFIAHAKSLEIPVYMSAALVAHILHKTNTEVTVIGVTGTRGKSTTTQMIAHILASCGLRTFIGGNIRGVANLPLLKALTDGDYLVLELDSWQLQGFGDLKISPHIGVFTSFLNDHMNYYKNDVELYFKDKSYIYTHQKEHDVLIASTQAAEEIRKRNQDIAITVPEHMHFDMKVVGEHNQVAASLAYEVGTQCGLSDEEIRQALSTFPGVEGRLQDMGLYGKDKQVRVFNDNNATSGDATIAAIDAINEAYNKKPILIIGGTDKGLSLDALEQSILVGAKTYIFLQGTGTSRLNLPKEHQYATLEECLEKAFEIASNDDIILFSPAFASFSTYFNNEYERNDRFVQALKKYQQSDK